MDVFAVHFCPQCGQPQALTRPMTLVGCPRCHHRDVAPLTSWLDRDKWDSGQLTARMFGCLKELDSDLTPRKARLLACAVARTQLTADEHNKLQEAVALGEEWADTGAAPARAVRARERLTKRGGRLWARLGARCLADAVDFEVRLHPIPELLAPVLRDLIPSPFTPLAWNPEWLTATVRDLAAHIYTAHEFSAMPILADALQDAGCDGEQVLAHCRANRPHARGCWVLDAILGKA